MVGDDAARDALHEDIRRQTAIKQASERSFAAVMAGALALVGAWRWWQGGGGAGMWMLGAVAVIAAGLLAPALLAPLNRAWTQLGLALSKVANPVVLGVLYGVVFVPMGLLMRLMGKDPLHLKFDAGAETYWIERNPPGPAPDSMKNPF